MNKHEQEFLELAKRLKADKPKGGKIPKGDKITNNERVRLATLYKNATAEHSFTPQSYPLIDAYSEIFPMWRYEIVFGNYLNSISYYFGVLDNPTKIELLRLHCHYIDHLHATLLSVRCVKDYLEYLAEGTLCTFSRIDGEDTVIAQNWVESERGWGTRPDGISIHRTEQERADYVKRYWDGMPNTVPDEYSRPEGDPYRLPLTLETNTLIGWDDGVRVFGADIAALTETKK
jgi:hypothetical protein